MILTKNSLIVASMERSITGSKFEGVKKQNITILIRANLRSKKYTALRKVDTVFNDKISTSFINKQYNGVEIETPRRAVNKIAHGEWKIDKKYTQMLQAMGISLFIDRGTKVGYSVTEFVYE